jgi:RimJ/RimL family protein N-acetyltransferase
VVPDDFAVSAGLRTEVFTLEPLSVRHNELDFAAWTSSIEHIRQTPGYPDGRWPRLMSPEQNTADLARHERDFASRDGFTYTVLDPATGDVIGCVYLYPSQREGYDADVRSWVRADRADLDKPLYEVVSGWLARDWPFTSPDYAPR